MANREDITRARYDKSHGYRIGILPRNKWIMAIVHNYLQQEGVVDMNRALFHEFTDKIEEFYLKHFKEFAGTPEGFNRFLRWMKNNVPEDDLREELLGKMRSNSEPSGFVR